MSKYYGQKDPADELMEDILGILVLCGILLFIIGSLGIPFGLILGVWTMIWWRREMACSGPQKLDT